MNARAVLVVLALTVFVISTGFVKAIEYLPDAVAGSSSNGIPLTNTVTCEEPSGTPKYTVSGISVSVSGAANPSVYLRGPNGGSTCYKCDGSNCKVDKLGKYEVVVGIDKDGETEYYKTGKTVYVVKVLYGWDTDNPQRRYTDGSTPKIELENYDSIRLSIYVDGISKDDISVTAKVIDEFDIDVSMTTKGNGVLIQTKSGREWDAIPEEIATTNITVTITATMSNGGVIKIPFEIRRTGSAPTITKIVGEDDGATYISVECYDDLCNTYKVVGKTTSGSKTCYKDDCLKTTTFAVPEGNLKIVSDNIGVREKIAIVNGIEITNYSRFKVDYEDTAVIPLNVGTDEAPRYILPHSTYVRIIAAPVMKVSSNKAKGNRITAKITDNQEILTIDCGDVCGLLALKSNGFTYRPTQQNDTASQIHISLKDIIENLHIGNAGTYPLTIDAEQIKALVVPYRKYQLHLNYDTKIAGIYVQVENLLKGLSCTFDKDGSAACNIGDPIELPMDGKIKIVTPTEYTTYLRKVEVANGTAEYQPGDTADVKTIKIALDGDSSEVDISLDESKKIGREWVIFGRVKIHFKVTRYAPKVNLTKVVKSDMNIGQPVIIHVKYSSPDPLKICYSDSSDNTIWAPIEKTLPPGSNREEYITIPTTCKPGATLYTKNNTLILPCEDQTKVFFAVGTGTTGCERIGPVAEMTAHVPECQDDIVSIAQKKENGKISDIITVQKMKDKIEIYPNNAQVTIDPSNSCYAGLSGTTNIMQSTEEYYWYCLKEKYFGDARPWQFTALYNDEGYICRKLVNVPIEQPTVELDPETVIAGIDTTITAQGISTPIEIWYNDAKISDEYDGKTHVDLWEVFKETGLLFTGQTNLELRTRINGESIPINMAIEVTLPSGSPMSIIKDGNNAILSIPQNAPRIRDVIWFTTAERPCATEKQIQDRHPAAYEYGTWIASDAFKNLRDGEQVCMVIETEKGYYVACSNGRDTVMCNP